MDEFTHTINISNFVTAIFMIIACYFGTIRFHETRHGMHKPFNDFIPIGFIEESLTPIEKRTHATIEKAHISERPKKQPIIQKANNARKEIPRNKNGFTRLQQDCFDALKGLKVTKKEATYIVHTVFNKHNPQTIQEFLQLAFMRGS